MYPAQALVDGAYTYEDLPDAIDVAGVVFTKLNPPESVAGFTRYYVNPDDEYLGILDGEEESLWSYEGGGGPCLINGYNGQGGEREDQFADSYTVTWTSPYTGEIFSEIVYRQSLCFWRSIHEDPFQYPTATLEYETEYIEGAEDRIYKWVLAIIEQSGAKPNPQNTPVGSYELPSSLGFPIFATVS